MTAPQGTLSLLRHVPPVALPSHGDYRQAAGVDLPIAVINLPHRTDRWEAISSRMAAVGLNKLIRMPAVYGADLTAAQIEGFLRAPAANAEGAPSDHLSLTRPAIGCFMSHLAVWRWVIETNAPRVLVFEDDAVPAPDFNAQQFRATLTTLPDTAGLVFGGQVIMNGMADKPTASASASALTHALARLYYFNGTFAYLITPAACRTLIAALDPPQWHIDHQISKVLFEQRNNFSAYYAAPSFFHADWSLRSDCYVPLTEETAADRALGALLDSRRQQLVDDGRPLLPPFA
jgi:glycosyl transferase, family 25